MSRIAKVGFEIEGGWKGDPRVSPFADTPLIADHSINGQSLGGAPAIHAPHVGEVVSKPFPYEEGEWKDWLVSHWPDAEPKDRTNRTCGFHIHLSTKSLRDYSLLSSKSFFFELKDEMNKVGERVKLPKKHVFWERVRGQNRFCTPEFDPANQMRINKKGGANRYGWLNFAWTMHGTMEFRALPTFRDAAVGLRFAEAYFGFVQGWLEKNQDVKLRREALLAE